MAVELTDKNFNEEIKEFKGVALVDFWAPWCGPCKMQGPIIEEVSEEFKGKDNIKISKLNVDENQQTASEFQVMSIPTLKIFKDGKAIEDMVGLQSKESLIEKINKNL
ncbi:thioredoxin [Candidatus Parcubacteria bacterium]|jgi:thioredoxin 1|nr:thioredoxin [Candidatus Parcubacteria bacterium]